MGLRIVPQVLEQAVAQSNHCIVLINQYVANQVPRFRMLVSATVYARLTRLSVKSLVMPSAPQPLIASRIPLMASTDSPRLTCSKGGQAQPASQLVPVSFVQIAITNAVVKREPPLRIPARYLGNLQAFLSHADTKVLHHF